MSTFSETAPFIDAPFLFNVLTHWSKGLDADLLMPAMRAGYAQHFYQQTDGLAGRDQGPEGANAGRANFGR